MYSENLEDLLNDGFSKKFADYYLGLAKNEYLNPAYSNDYVEWAHSKGFLAESASAYNLSENNITNYLSDYDYYKIWPLNSWNRIWINDKLTLKYMLDNTEFSSVMPNYYYYTAQDGLKKLVDAPDKNSAPDVAEFKRVLKMVGEFACKPCNGTTSQGFFKMSYNDGKIFVDSNELQDDELESFLDAHRNYVFTEYLHPSELFKQYSEKIHTLRIVTVNENGCNPIIIGGYLRLPHKLSGEANYAFLASGNSNAFNVCVDVNYDSGEFESGYKIYNNHKEKVDLHPDTGVSLSGRIENYDLLKETIFGIAKRFSCIEYMGFDIGITNNGFKIMEINSHPGIKYMQIFTPFLQDGEWTRDYYLKKISYVDTLPSEMKKKRNDIVR